MPGKQTLYPFICARCLRDRAGKNNAIQATRKRFTTTRKLPLSTARAYRDGEAKTKSGAISTRAPDTNDTEKTVDTTREPGAMTQRLSSLSKADLTGTSKADIESSGFSEDLKAQLLSRIESASSARSLNPTAFAVSELPTSAGAGTRYTAAAEAWTGTESLADGALRMLTDAHKPIRSPVRIPSPARPPSRVDTGRPSGPKPGAIKGARLANARDRSSMYNYLKDNTLSASERDRVRAELKERFTPSARPMPTTLQGLASLANERIEDAIQRGQFANLPSRGKQIERDHNASSPFLDTTEYFMNKIIQKQEIVPPWIEKQQELAAAVGRFRARLRSDWRRHAARSIASEGGGVEMQVARAEGYARAEMVANPPRRKKGEQAAMVEEVVKEMEHLSQISLTGDLATQPVSNPTLLSQEQPPPEQPMRPITTEAAPISTTSPSPAQPRSQAPDPLQDQTIRTSTTTPDASPQPPAPAPAPAPAPPTQTFTATHPFRDPTWLTHERSYLTHAISNLNALTRSYNLQAPQLAQKPYYTLDRELLFCYSDVAPLLPNEIRERALGPRADGGGEGVGSGRRNGVLGGLTGDGHVARVRDEVAGRQYGFKEFLRDLFGSGKEKEQRSRA